MYLRNSYLPCGGEKVVANQVNGEGAAGPYCA